MKLKQNLKEVLRNEDEIPLKQCFKEHRNITGSKKISRSIQKVQCLISMSFRESKQTDSVFSKK